MVTLPGQQNRAQSAVDRGRIGLIGPELSQSQELRILLKAECVSHMIEQLDACTLTVVLRIGLN